MARRSTPRQRPAARAAASAAADPRVRIIDALMSLLSTRDFAQIGLADVAREAGVSLGALRASYDGKLGILADFSKRIDEAVLAGGPAEGGEARDRLFEVMMRRFDALAPHKPALRNLARAARRDLNLACAL